MDATAGGTTFTVVLCRKAEPGEDLVHRQLHFGAMLVLVEREVLSAMGQWIDREADVRQAIAEAVRTRNGDPLVLANDVGPILVILPTVPNPVIILKPIRGLRLTADNPPDDEDHEAEAESK